MRVCVCVCIPRIRGVQSSSVVQAKSPRYILFKRGHHGHHGNAFSRFATSPLCFLSSSYFPLFVSSSSRTTNTMRLERSSTMRIESNRFFEIFQSIFESRSLLFTRRGRKNISSLLLAQPSRIAARVWQSSFPDIWKRTMDGQTFRECLRIVEWQTWILAIGRLSIIDILAARPNPDRSLLTFRR